MRKRLFDRLPGNVRRLDRDPTREDGRGVLQRFLEVIDCGFDLVEAKARGVLSTRSPDSIPDRWLPLLTLAGHIWRSDKDRLWNRRRIKNSIPRHSYKGTLARVEDLLRECGASQWFIEDMASRICVLGHQGNLGTRNCFIMGPDYCHEGAFVIHVDDGIDLDEFRRQFTETRPGGTRWYVVVHTANSDMEDELHLRAIEIDGVQRLIDLPNHALLADGFLTVDREDTTVDDTDTTVDQIYRVVEV